MERIPEPILWLSAYWLIFWLDFIVKPFRLCTSELASTFFPFWRWSKGRITFKDNIYYEYPACIPFLSSFYPTNIITSWLSQFLSLNNSFILFEAHILGHYLLASIFAYYLLLPYGIITALFGAISLTYSAYFIKPLTPCAIYTHAWAIGALAGGKLGAICFGMSILGGYWPTLIYLAPVILIWHPITIFGLILGLPQIIPFLWYWPKSVRSGKIQSNEYNLNDPKIGKVPLWRYLDLILPNQTQNSINGVFWPEMAMYCGIIPFIILTGKLSVWIVPLMLSLFIRIQRIQARSLYLFTICLIMIAVNQKITFPILILQGWLLLENNRIYPHFPFCQWWKKPSQFNYETSGWPGFSGYITGKHKIKYKGGFALRG